MHMAWHVPTAYSRRPPARRIGAADPSPFLYPPTPQSIQTLLDADAGAAGATDAGRARTILRHALAHAVTHADVELTTWLTSVQGDLVSTIIPDQAAHAFGSARPASAARMLRARRTAWACRAAASPQGVTVVCVCHSPGRAAWLAYLMARMAPVIAAVLGAPDVTHARARAAS